MLAFTELINWFFFSLFNSFLLIITGDIVLFIFDDIEAASSYIFSSISLSSLLITTNISTSLSGFILPFKLEPYKIIDSISFEAIFFANLSAIFFITLVSIEKILLIS